LSPTNAAVNACSAMASNSPQSSASASVDAAPSSCSPSGVVLAKRCEPPSFAALRGPPTAPRGVALAASGASTGHAAVAEGLTAGSVRRKSSQSSSRTIVRRPYLRARNLPSLIAPKMDVFPSGPSAINSSIECAGLRLRPSLLRSAGSLKALTPAGVSGVATTHRSSRKHTLYPTQTGPKKWDATDLPHLCASLWPSDFVGSCRSSVLRIYGAHRKARV